MGRHRGASSWPGVPLPCLRLLAGAGWGLAPLRSSAGAKPSVGPWGLLSFTPWGWAAGAELGHGRATPEHPGLPPPSMGARSPGGFAHLLLPPAQLCPDPALPPAPPSPAGLETWGGGGARGGKPALAVGNAGRGVARLAATVEARRGAAGRVLPSARGTVPRVGQRRTRRAVGHGPWDVGPGRRGGGTGDVGRGRKAGRGTRRGRCGRRS